MQTDTPLRIGTRASPLAMKQAEMVRDQLMDAHPDLRDRGIDLVSLSTKGDRIIDRPLAEIGGKGLFTEEIERGLYTGDVDLAVHSMKDVATQMPDGLVMEAILEREDIRDAFLSPKATHPRDLPDGSVIGTSALRREAQLRAAFPNLKVISFRGNVQTRLRKLDEGVADATLLALAGLKRLDMAEIVQHVFEPDELLPAVAQGAIGIQCHADREDIRTLLQPLNHAVSEITVNAERAMLAALDGSCRTPIASHARIDGERLIIDGLIARTDGSEVMRLGTSGAVSEAVALGHALGSELRKDAGDDFFSDIT